LLFEEWEPLETLLPVFLKLAGRKVVLVGGGPVAAAKLPALVKTGAKVVVVAPEVGPELERALVVLERRPFEESDLDDAWFVVAAATPEVNRRVRAACDARRLFVNAVDDPATASAYTGGVLRRGGVTLVTSTEGRAPALAGLLREALEALIPEDIEAWVVQARRLKARQQTAGTAMRERRPALLRALNALYAGRSKGSAA
jgi:uroporphyrin-III C-methyltransferase/precorrin-2 dehydrogenase/sirohydrochlorin ferrochelatase